MLARTGDALGVGGSTDFGWKQWLLLALGVLLVAVGGVLLVPTARRALRDRGSPAVDARRWPRATLPALVGLAAGVAVLLWTRIVGVDQSLWHDEAFSVLHFALGGPETILGSQEYVPNDHVLFNLLSWATVELLGESPASRRLWAVLPALAAVALIAAWAWRRLGPATAIALVLLVAASPTHLELAKEARGYGLTFLCGAGMLVAADRLLSSGSRGALAGFGVAGFAGVATLPVFVLAFVMQAAPALVRRDLRERVLLVVVVVGVAALGLYWSLLEDVVGNASQRFGPAVPWHGFVTGPLDALLGPLVALVLHTTYEPTLLWRVGVGLVLLAGFALLAARGERALAALLACPLLGTYALLALGGFHAETRFSSFLLFHALVPVALLPAAAVSARSRVLRPLVAAVAAVAIVIALGRVLEQGRAQAARPKEAFAEAAEVVRGTGIPRVVSDTIRPAGLAYALGGRRFTTLPRDALQQFLCRESPPFVFVEHPFAPQPPYRRRPPTDTSCLERRGASRVHLRQRERGGFIEVWILPERR